MVDILDPKKLDKLPPYQLKLWEERQTETHHPTFFFFRARAETKGKCGKVIAAAEENQGASLKLIAPAPGIFFFVFS